MNLFFTSFAASFLMFLAFTTAVNAGGRPAPESKTGLKIGSKAPDFALKDQNGKERTLKELCKKGKVALVFYRSAKW